MTLKKSLIYLAISCCNGAGDVLLKRGMSDLGQIHLSHWSHIFAAFLNPWIIFGIICLAGFFYSYLTALSWADLTFVLPASAFGYVVTAFLSRVFLHESVSPWRWAGVLLITCGVGLVARGPSLTVHAPAHSPNQSPGDDSQLAGNNQATTQRSDNKQFPADRQLGSKEQHELA